MDVLERVKKFRSNQKRLNDLSLKARNGDTKAAHQLMDELSKEAISERELIDDLIKEVKKLRKQLEGK